MKLLQFVPCFHGCSSQGQSSEAAGCEYKRRSHVHQQLGELDKSSHCRLFLLVLLCGRLRKLGFFVLNGLFCACLLLFDQRLLSLSQTILCFQVKNLQARNINEKLGVFDAQSLDISRCCRCSNRHLLICC